MRYAKSKPLNEETLMKRIIILITFVLLAFFTSNAQIPTAEWIRVQSDNGEFSIEVPAEYEFFADKDGFSVSFNSDTYPLREMNVLNGIHEKTLISFESYKADKRALDIIRERDSRQAEESSEIKREGYRVKQIVSRNKDSYSVRQYFNSKDYIYILTAASREGETPTLKRFLDSVIFKPSGEKTIQTTALDSKLKTISFSALKPTPIEVETSSKPSQTPNDTVNNAVITPAPKDENILPLAILYKPLPSFTDAARMQREQGIIRLRLGFSQAGYISKIAVVSSLKEGLLRQAIFAALRIKFLPPEKDGKPQTVTKLVEYSFAVY